MLIFQAQVHKVKFTIKGQNGLIVTHHYSPFPSGQKNPLTPTTIWLLSLVGKVTIRIHSRDK